MITSLTNDIKLNAQISKIYMQKGGKESEKSITVHGLKKIQLFYLAYASTCI